MINVNGVLGFAKVALQHLLRSHSCARSWIKLQCAVAYRLNLLFHLHETVIISAIGHDHSVIVYGLFPVLNYCFKEYMLLRSIFVATLLAFGVLAGGAVGSIPFYTVVATTAFVVSSGPGISLADATSAFGSENVRDDLRLQSITVFDKSGGRADDGQKQQVLRVDLPVRIARDGNDVAFQYFVDVRNDLNGQKAFHCGDTRIHVYLDTKKVFVSGWMGYDDRNPQLPLKTSKITIHDVPGGLHYVGLIPEARTGGCNSGFIQSWGGTAVFFES